jgi:hypothetical protein
MDSFNSAGKIGDLHLFGPFYRCLSGRPLSANARQFAAAREEYVSTVFLHKLGPRVYVGQRNVSMPAT